MSDHNSQHSALNALYALNAALRNLRLYPPTSEMIRNTLSKAHAALSQGCDEVGGELLFAESERRLLIGDTPLGESDQQKPQVATFLKKMLDFKIKSISFSPGLGLDELNALLDIFKEDPDKVAEAGGLEQVLSEKKLSHIVLNAKRYVTAGPKTPPNQAALGGDPGNELPLGGGSTEPKAHGHDFAIPGLKVHGEDAPIPADRAIKPAQAPSDSSLPKTAPKPSPPSPGAAGGMSKAKLNKLRTALQAAMQGQRAAFRDEDFLAWLPQAVHQLEQTGKEQSAYKLAARLGNELLAGEATERPLLADSLLTVAEAWGSATPLEERHQLTVKLLAWFKMETAPSPELARSVDYLSRAAESYLQAGRVGKGRTIVETFQRIRGGEIQKPPAIRELADKGLLHLVQPDMVRRLLYLLQEEEGKQRDQTVATLALMGPKVLGELLERLKASDHMAERLRLIRVIEKMGKAALPPIVEQIQQRPGPWYYLRNLIVILGKIGNETQIAVLAPLLRAPDDRIQKEVLNSMARIGGQSVDRVLLPFFSEAGDDLRQRIVELWGSMHSEGAVEPLVALLEDRSLVTSKARAELEEKICIALGKIGTPPAIAALTKVAQHKGLLKSYPARVVDAAQNALAAHSE